MALTLAGCAEEGPFKAGVFESEIEIGLVTPTTASISVIYPDTPGQLFDPTGYSGAEVYLLQTGITHTDKYISGMEVSTVSESGKTTVVYTFSDLSPNTDYDIFVLTEVLASGDYEHSRYKEKMGSFRTKNQLDYSELGNLTCTLGEKCPYPFINVTLTLPEGLYICDHYSEDYIVDSEINIYVSSDPLLYDYRHVYESMMGKKDRKINFKLDIDESIENLYFRITGDFFYEPYHLWFRDINIDIPEPLVITESDFTPLVAETAFCGSNFSIIKFSMPEGFVWNPQTVQYAYSSDMGEVTECETSTSRWENNVSVFYALLPEKIEQVKNLYFDISATVRPEGTYTDYTSSFQPEVVFNPENALVPNPSVETIFYGNDKTALKFNYPAEIIPKGDYNLGYSDYDYSFFLSPDTNFEEATSVLNRDPKCLIIDTSDISQQNHIRIKGDFQICGISLSDTSLDFAGQIDKTPSGRNLYDISKSENENDVVFTLTCAKEFGFIEVQWGGNPMLEFYDTNGKKISLTHSPQSTLYSDRIEFTISTSDFNKLKENGECSLVITYFNIKYGDYCMIEEYVGRKVILTMTFDSSNVSNMSKTNSTAIGIRR